jgi:hypothetical protein
MHGGSSPSRARRALSVVLVVVAVTVVLGSLASVYVTQTQSGRAWLARRIEQVVSDAIPGSLVIGRINAVRAWPLSLDSEDLKFLDANGMTVLHARKVTAAIAPFAWIGGRLHVTEADVEGGQLVIALQHDGRTSLEAALCAPTVGYGHGPANDMPLRFDTIAVRQYVVELKPPHGDVIRIRQQTARVKLESPPVVVDLHDIQGRVQTPQIIGTNVNILRAQGWVHGDVPHVLELTLETAIGNGKLDARVSYFNRKQTPVVVLINPHDGLQAEFAGFLIEASTWGSDAVEVTFDERVTQDVTQDVTQEAEAAR